MLSKLFALTILAITAVTAEPCLSSDFSLAMRIGVGAADNTLFVTLNAIDSGTKGTLYLVGERLWRYPGTPVAVKGASGKATLDFKIDAANSNCNTLDVGSYGISVPDLGEVYGASAFVTATKGYNWPHFYHNQGEISPQLTAAPQGFFVCDSYIRGQSYLSLKFGVFNENGTSPTGCAPTKVIQVFNIRCGDD